MRSDFDVHRSGVIESLRDSGSTSLSSAPNQTRFKFLGPLATPARRAGAPAPPHRFGVIELVPPPTGTMSGETCTASATTRTLLRPSSRASAPSQTRR